MFVHCNKCRPFWTFVKDFTLDLTGNQVILDTQTISFGDVGLPLIINSIIILTKYYIYACRIKDTEPYYKSLKCILQRYKKCFDVLGERRGGL